MKNKNDVHNKLPAFIGSGRRNQLIYSGKENLALRARSEIKGSAIFKKVEGLLNQRLLNVAANLFQCNETSKFVRSSSSCPLGLTQGLTPLLYPDHPLETIIRILQNNSHSAPAG